MYSYDEESANLDTVLRLVVQLISALPNMRRMSVCLVLTFSNKCIVQAGLIRKQMYPYIVCLDLLILSHVTFNEAL